VAGAASSERFHYPAQGTDVIGLFFSTGLAVKNSGKILAKIGLTSEFAWRAIFQHAMRLVVIFERKWGPL
jgi:hypothetical protein